MPRLFRPRLGDDPMSLPTLAQLRESFPELDEGRCEMLLRVIHEAVADGPPGATEAWMYLHRHVGESGQLGTVWNSPMSDGPLKIHERRVLILPEGK